MSNASNRVETRGQAWTERWQSWIAWLVSALLHVLMLLALLYSSTLTMTTPQGGDGGGRVQVDFIGETPPTREPVPSPPPLRARPQTPPATSPVQSTLVEQAENPVPPNAPQPVERPIVAPQQPPDAADEPAQGRVPAPAASPPPTWRRSHVRGQPPGTLPQATSSVNAGRARGTAAGRGRGSDASTQPSLEVDGYQVIYDQRSEARLREWRDRGITELFLPLPGTSRLMVCPLETALRRESGPCRMIEPDSPELEAIGDAREVIFMQRVYRQGEAVWRGPGPYR